MKGAPDADVSPPSATGLSSSFARAAGSRAVCAAAYPASARKSKRQGRLAAARCAPVAPSVAPSPSQPTDKQIGCGALVTSLQRC